MASFDIRGFYTGMWRQQAKTMNCTCKIAPKLCTIHKQGCACGITGPLNCPLHGQAYSKAWSRMNQNTQTHKSGVNEPAKIWVGENGAVKVRAPYQASFVAYAKMFSPSKRRYLKEANIWEFEYELLPEVLKLLRKFYSDVITLNINEDKYKAQEQYEAVSTNDAWSNLYKLLDKADLDIVYRALAKKNHPDIGGNKIKMASINEVFNKLRQTS